MAETKRSTPSADLGDTFIPFFRESRMALFFTAFPTTIFPWVFVRLFYVLAIPGIRHLHSWTPSPLYHL